jgi:hypothetical protein
VALWAVAALSVDEEWMEAEIEVIQVLDEEEVLSWKTDG